MNWTTEMTITTERLLLRPIAVEDTAFVRRLYADWEIAKNLNKVPYPFTHSDAEAHVTELLSEAKRGITGTFLITTTNDGTIIGLVSLHLGQDDPKRSIGVVGYSIVRSHWGNGYATESVDAITKEASRLGFHKLQASTVAENLASQRVLKKLGFVLVETGIMEEPLHGPAREVHKFMKEVGGVNTKLRDES
jgi:RimJ/RimL family protein N-acetyltransferase